MRIGYVLIVALVALLSIAAGLAKVMQIPQEMEFLQGFGFSTGLIVLFGLVQVAGGVLLAPKKTRRVGAILAAATLVVSAVLLFMAGNFAFGLFSILPVVLACIIIYQSARNQGDHSPGEDSGAA